MKNIQSGIAGLAVIGLILCGTIVGLAAAAVFHLPR